MNFLDPITVNTYILVNLLQLFFNEYGGLYNEFGRLTGYSLVLVHYYWYWEIVED